MTIWVLTICTSITFSMGLCGQIVEKIYPTEESCYKAMDELYNKQGKKDFKWVTCSLKLQVGNK